MFLLFFLSLLCLLCQQSLGEHYAARRLSASQAYAARELSASQRDTARRLSRSQRYTPRRLSVRQGAEPKASSPFDHTWIQEWAAVGDSYAAGVGSGKRIGYWCSLYDAAYPSLINNDESLGDRNRKFNNLACTGYTASNVKDKAINTLSSNQDIITISAGGNDVYFGEIVNACVFRVTRYDCPYWLNEFKNSVEGDKLKNDLTDMINAAKSKLAFSNSRIFWVLYSHFFDTTTHECDSVQWATPAEYSPDLNFTVERREMFNGLVDQLNDKIKDVASAAGDQVVVVDWDNQIDDLVGKYCEPGVDETLGKGDDRESLAFYEWYSTLDDNLYGNSIQDSTWSVPTNGDTVTATNAPQDQMGPYQASIAQDLENAMKGNQTMIDKIHYYLPETSDNNDPHALGGLASDKIIRNFHPQSNGHQRIANAVLSALENEQAKDLGQPAATTTAFGCTAPTGISSHPGTRDTCYVDKPPPNIAKFNRQTGLIMSNGFCQDHTGEEVGTGDGIKGSKPNDDNGQILMSASHRTDGDCASTGDSKIYLSYDDCEGYFQAAIDSCDTDTVTEKQGGIYAADCVAYSIYATSQSVTPNTINVDGGTLACESANHNWQQGDTEHYMTLDDINSSKDDFCQSLKDSGMIIGGSGGTALQSSATRQGAVGQVEVTDGQNCGAPLDFSGDGADDALQLCKDRLGVTIDDCDTSSNGQQNWKAGGTYERDCFKWSLATNLDSDS